MGIIRPATPGFLVTLVAAILLAIVSFSVPYFKSVYFLKASLSVENIDGTVTFGTLGYCLEISGQATNCTKPHIGYSLDINKLIGNDTPIDIPNVVVKWLTYALFLHVIALVLAAVSALFGLLAHVREMSMAYCSTCVSGFGAAVALLAFIFDIAFFFIAKSRLNDVKGGSATIGNAIWLTLGAWILLFFAGCFFGLGRCCIKRRPRGPRDSSWAAPGYNNRYEEQMRLDAVKAEADRKAAAKRGEGGLPAFHEYDPSQPLNPAKVEFAHVDGDNIISDEEFRQQELRDNAAAGNNGRQYAGGYAPQPAGASAADQYYNDGARRQPSNVTYPPQSQQQSQQPQTRRQGSGHSGYSAYTNNGYQSSSTPPLPVGAAAAVAGATAAGGYMAHQAHNQQGLSAMPGAAAAGQYLTPPGVHGQYPTQASGYGYNHGQDQTSYHSAHSQYPSQYNDPYSQGAQRGHAAEATFGTASTPGTMYNPYSQQPSPSPSHQDSHGSYYASGNTPSPSAQGAAVERSYTLGGGGYGASTVPDTHANADSDPYGGYASTSAAAAFPMPGAGNTSPIRGPRSPPPRNVMSSPEQFDESPPQYDAGLHVQQQPAWSEKR